MTSLLFQDSLDLDLLTAYVSKRLARPVTLQTCRTSTVDGGYIAAAVYRHDLVFLLDDGISETISFVQKHTYNAKARVMQALAKVSGTDAVPLLIDSARNPAAVNDNGASWFITPFYEGPFLTWGVDVPQPVIESLARIHAHFASNAHEWDWLHHVDEKFLRRTFDNALKALEMPQDQAAAPVYSEAYEHLKRTSEVTTVYTALAKLPVTLTHGDLQYLP